MCALIKGQNDLKTWCEQNGRMDILLEWDCDKNDNLTPSDVTYGMGKKVWWKCSCGYEWCATINSRTNSKSGCPVCGRIKRAKSYSENRLKTNGSIVETHPEIAKEWNYERNGDLRPEDFSFGVRQNVWWKCSKGHEWETTINNRTTGSGCPACGKTKSVEHRIKNKIGKNGSLADVNPTLAKEWHPTKNAPLSPFGVTAVSGRKVWWLGTCGHEWESTIASRSSKNLGCPICSSFRVLVGFNDLATTHPEVAAEWNYEKNGSLTPQQIVGGYNQKVWWKCNKGHEWKANVNSRTSGGVGCPFCCKTGSSKPEQGIAYYLEQCCEIKQRTKICKCEIDIYLPEYSIGIEYDGAFYHRNKQAQDEQKSKILGDAGVILIRVIESDANRICDDNIYYQYDDMGENYEWALNILMKKIASLTSNDSFCNVSIDTKKDSIKIRERYDLYLKENSFAFVHPELVCEWNDSRNGILRPDMFSCFTREKVWWKCSKGHEWCAPIADRSNGRGCPVCSNKEVLVGYNDLATTNPDLLEEWNYERNTLIAPTQVTIKSGKKVWWKCVKGHEWEATIAHRSSGRGCPICSNKQVLIGYNDLSTTHPDLAKDWNYERNGNLTPEKVVAGSQKEVWWRCNKGHEWCDSICHRISGRGCSVCSNHRIVVGINDLATTNPELINEWDYDKNGELTPEKVVAGSEKKVWWKCSKGHEWSAYIFNRAKHKSGCPVCAGSEPKRVLCVETNIVYSSLAEAAKSCGLESKDKISLCCKGKRKTAGSYHWQYVDEGK